MTAIYPTLKPLSNAFFFRGFHEHVLSTLCMNEPKIFPKNSMTRVNPVLKYLEVAVGTIWVTFAKGFFFSSFLRPFVEHLLFTFSIKIFLA